MAIVARRTLYFSISSSILDFFRIPAVSIKTKLPLSLVKRESMASRVVPATLDTMTRSSPKIWFTREDLPALGLPMKMCIRDSSWGQQIQHHDGADHSAA